MMRTAPLALAAMTLALFATGCRAIELVFKAGVWSGILLLIGALVIVFAASRLFGRTLGRRS